MRTVHGLCLGLSFLAALGGCSTINEKLAGSQGATIDTLGQGVCTLVVNLSGGKPSTDPAFTEPVKRVVARLGQASKDSGKVAWDAQVLDVPKQNAFACPGGKIVVYKGIFAVAKDENGLAALLGHEMTHALNRDMSPPLDKTLIASAPAIAGSITAAKSMEDLSPDAKRVLIALGAAALFGETQAFSQEQELIADQGGIMLMAQAGYDPAEYTGVLSRLSLCQGKSTVPQFLSSHPNDATRTEAINKLLPQAQEAYNKSDQAAPTPDLPSKPCQS